MTTCTTLSDFAARWREFIHSPERGIKSEPIHNAGARTALSARCRPRVDVRTRLSALRSDYEFNQMALTLFALQFTHNAPYRRFCQARGVSPETITDWANIPAIPTSAFKELELTSLPPAECTTIFHSSGTTEQRPSRHFHDAESLAVYEASLLSWFAVHLLTERSVGRVKVGGERPPSPRPSPPGEGAGSSAHEQFKNKFRILSLTPSPTEAPDSSLVHMFETVRREFGTRDSIFTGQVAGDGAWSVNSEKTMAALRESPKQPLVFLGTAFGFVHLLDHLGEKQIPLPRGSRVLETGGYKGRSRELLKAELHALITERLGIPPTHIVCEYGMSELSSQAYDRIAGGDANSKPSTLNPQPCFRFPPWARAQIISPETGHEVGEGETGLIRVFDLANVWSVMAVQTEDLGVRRGDGFELIGRAKAAEPRGCSLMAS